MAAKRICPHPGCSHTEPCPAHAETRRKEYDKARGPASERGYDRQWRKVRKRFLSLHPLCQDCLAEGKTTPAHDVHHLVPVKQGPMLRLDMTNLRSLCRACHNARERAA